MKTLPTGLLTQASATEQAPCFLVEISGWGGSTVRWADSDADVVYGGNTYTARPFSVGAVSVSDGNVVWQLQLTVANHDLYVSSLCASNDPRGVTVTVYRVFLDDLTSAYTLATGLRVDSYKIVEKAVTFQCSMLSVYLRGKRVPYRTFDRVCPWEFKGPECSYTGVATSCDHTDERCKQLGNFDNFGGFLFVLPKKW